MFWGILFLAIGVIFIIQHIFSINIPILRVLLGLILIYWGIKVIFGSFGMHFHGLNFKYNKIANDTEVIFSEGNLNVKTKEDGRLNKEFSTIFGSSFLDLSGLTEEDLKESFEINNVFGKTVVKIPSQIPIRVTANTAFGSVHAMGSKMGILGEASYNSPEYDDKKAALNLVINCVFGEVEIR